MTAERTLGVLLLIAVTGGCSSTASGSTDSGTDGIPSITYEPFVSKTWSLSTTAGTTQLSITDGGSAAACALATDYRQTLGAAGVQIILQLPGMPPSPCPIGEYMLSRTCTTALGTGAYVPAGCAYYRKWDAQGQVIGIAIAHDGLLKIAGTDSSCTLQVSITFIGNSFIENFTLMNGAGMEPWCRES